MLKDLRAIWCEDQYQLLGMDRSKKKFYFGRQKGDKYWVYERSSDRRFRKVVQIESFNRDLYWCDKVNRVVNYKLLNQNIQIKRKEHILQGYCWSPNIRPRIIENLSAIFSKRQFVLPSGAEVMTLTSGEAKQWVLSLHGGPESYEGHEIRYGGIYRDLLRAGYSVVILNYRGSKKLGRSVSKKIWGSWKSAICEDFVELLQSISSSRLNKQPHSVFGVSFGGALSLLLQKEFLLPKVVLSSPLLDLSHQMERAPEDQKLWFKCRFSIHDFENFSFQNLCSGAYGKKSVFYSYEDEVIGNEIFKKLESTIDDSWLLYRETCGHSPRSYKEYRTRFDRIFAELTGRKSEK